MFAAALSSVASAALTSAELLTNVRSEMRPSSYLLKSSTAASKIDELCRSLEDGGTRPAWPRDLMVLDGRWKLVYSSSLALPLPPIEPLSDPLAGLLEELPFAPQSVEQRIDVVDRRVVNVVSLSPWPSGGPAELLSSLPGIGGALTALKSAVVTLELDHTFSVEGEGGSSGGMRKAAAGSVVEVELQRIRRTLGKEGAEGDSSDDGWNDMLNPQVRKEVRAAREQANAGGLFGNPLLDAVPTETFYELPGAFCRHAQLALPSAVNCIRRLADWLLQLLSCSSDAPSVVVRSQGRWARSRQARSTRPIATSGCASPAARWAGRLRSCASSSGSARRSRLRRCTPRGRRRCDPRP